MTSAPRSARPPGGRGRGPLSARGEGQGEVPGASCSSPAIPGGPGRGRLSAIVAAAVIGLVAILAAPDAHAYPQWQFSSGTSRCNQCHYAPAGGGLLTGYGRDAAGEDLSTWQGDGGFLHGAVELPKALALGGEFRYALLNNDVGESRGAKLVHFPMQADAYIRIAFTDSVSLYGSAGYRGQARSGGGPFGGGAALPEANSRFISREHYLMWRPAALGPYVRAGRFYAPFGLRLVEHYAYIRTDTGYNLLQENYGLSGGVVKNEWELHLSVFAPDLVRHIGSEERGFAGLFEKRFGDVGALGLQTRVGLREDANRFIGGAFVKYYLESAKSMIQAEGNLVHTTFAGPPATNGFVGYLGLTFFPFKGFWITPFGERSQTSIQVKDSATNVGGIQLNWFPYPHFEIGWVGRFQDPAGPASAYTGLAFFHYYL
jgi:hypothetical protein